LATFFRLFVTFCRAHVSFNFTLQLHSHTICWCNLTFKSKFHFEIENEILSSSRLRQKKIFFSFALKKSFFLLYVSWKIWKTKISNVILWNWNKFNDRMWITIINYDLTLEMVINCHFLSLLKIFFIIFSLSKNDFFFTFALSLNPLCLFSFPHRRQVREKITHSMEFVRPNIYASM
jgi:hypothetical protein